MALTADGTRGGAASLATLHGALHVLSFVVALTLAFASFDGTLFGWHPFGMALGYVFFMAEGLIAAWAIRPALPEERVRGLQFHALMQLWALLFAAVGGGAIVYNKHLKGRPHFKTTHGKLGLLTLILTVLSPLLGVFSFRKLGLIQRLPDHLQPRIKKLHRLLGAVTWGLALVTVQLGLPHGAVYKAIATPAWQLGTAAAGVMMALLLYGKRRTGTVKGI